MFQAAERDSYQKLDITPQNRVRDFTYKPDYRISNARNTIDNHIIFYLRHPPFTPVFAIVKLLGLSPFFSLLFIPTSYIYNNGPFAGLTFRYNLLLRQHNHLQTDHSSGLRI